MKVGAGCSDCNTCHNDDYNDNNNRYIFFSKVGVHNSSRLINANHFDTRLLTNKTE